MGSQAGLPGALRAGALVADAARNGKALARRRPAADEAGCEPPKCRRHLHEHAHRLNANCRPVTPLTRIQQQSDVRPQPVLILPTADSPRLGLNPRSARPRL